MHAFIDTSMHADWIVTHATGSTCHNPTNHMHAQWGVFRFAHHKMRIACMHACM
jgi:hypothetical protein